MSHRIVCHLMKGGVLRAMMGKLRTIPRLRKLTTSGFLLTGTFCNLVVAGDHHPPPQIALILVAESVETLMMNLFFHANTWCEEGWSGRRGHPQGPSPQRCACNQTSWPSPPKQLLYLMTSVLLDWVEVIIMVDSRQSYPLRVSPRLFPHQKVVNSAH